MEHIATRLPAVGPEALASTCLEGSCIGLLPLLPEGFADLVVTDPPYLVRYRDRQGRSLMGDDDPQWVGPAFAEIYRALSDDAFCISFYGWNTVDVFMGAWKRAGFRPVGHIVWTKGYASKTGYLQARHEQAYLLAKGRPPEPARPISDVRRWVYSGNGAHPTQKAVRNMAGLIEAFSQPGDMVLDPFAGSGSTLVAAARTGRRYLGIEKDPRHCATARARLAKVGG